MLKTIELLNIFVETMKLFFQDFTYIVFIVTFDQFNASLLNTSINFIKKKKSDPKLLNITVCYVSVHITWF